MIETNPKEASVGREAERDALTTVRRFNAPFGQEFRDISVRAPKRAFPYDLSYFSGDRPLFQQRLLRNPSITRFISLV